MITIRGLSSAYQPDTPTLQGINLDLRSGERVAILGPNGSGKSTLLKCIVGLLPPTAGTIDLAEHQDRIGLVFQNPNDQIVSPTVESEIAFGLENIGLPRGEMVERVERAMERFDLTRYRKADPHSLSGGERQRLAVTSIVVMKPDFILFDEPFSMLDPAYRDELSSLLRNIHKDGITPIVVSHDPDDALDADRLLFLESGSVVFDGPPSDLLAVRRQDAPTPTTTVGRLGRACALPDPVPIARDELIDRLRGTTEPSLPVLKETRRLGGPIIQVSGLSYAYDSGLPNEHQALEEVDLTVSEGQFLSIVGQGGSGKTTLVLHLNGLLTPSRGRLTVEDMDTADRKTHDQLRRRVGLVFQFPESQLFAETVRDDVAYGPRNLGMTDIDTCIDRALAAVDLPPDRFADRSPFSLSGGERRRVALAGVLATNPSVLVLDEPTAGLDPGAAAELDQLLTELNRSGTTVLMVTHDLSRAVSLSDGIICLEKGRIAASLTSDEFSDLEALSRLGLPIPTGIQLMADLRDLGWAIPPSVRTSDQLANLLLAEGDATA
ncbi:MAG: energy-coupling factor transporter ATPase [Gemmatimonadetes bacterium]|nr:energy-coupling factor transporter ATPase [Gemmatimonadota bacterium]